MCYWHLSCFVLGRGYPAESQPRLSSIKGVLSENQAGDLGPNQVKEDGLPSFPTVTYSQSEKGAPTWLRSEKPQQRLVLNVMRPCMRGNPSALSAGTSFGTGKRGLRRRQLLQLAA